MLVVYVLALDVFHFFFFIQYANNNESYKVSNARENISLLLGGSKLSYNKSREITILKRCVN